MMENEVAAVAVTILVTRLGDGTVNADLYEAPVPPLDVLPVLEVAGAQDAATAVEVLLRAFGLDAQLIKLPEGHDE